jgi:hypothetical protein
MSLVSRSARLLLVVLSAVALWCSRASAQAVRPQTLHILEIDSDDADEQAEALTGALRSRARTAPGWILLDTTQSLSMLTAALRCPQRPDPMCLQHIADQLKAERFIWGIMTKQGAGPHQVTVELHLWARGKPDVSIKETYSDNLKDQGDDTLRKIANRAFERLTGTSTAPVTVHAGTIEGTVMVDGDQRIPLHQGLATLSLTSGPHTIEVQAPGFATARQTVLAGATNQDVTFDLRPQVPEVVAPAPPSSRSGKKLLKWGMLIGGGALLVAGGVLAGVFEAERATLNSDLQRNYDTGSTTPISNPCQVANPNSEETSGCSAHNVAQAVLVPELVSFGVGAALTTVGIVLFVRDHGSDEPQSASPVGLQGVKIDPALSPRGSSLKLSVAF